MSYSNFPKRVADTKTDYHSSFNKLFYLIPDYHAFNLFSQIRKLTFDYFWCLDMFYYPTFFMHQNVRMDFTKKVFIRQTHKL